MSTPTVVIEGSSGFWTSATGGLIGATSALLVYGLGQRAARRKERDVSSVEAAGQLLLALNEYDQARHSGMSLALAELDAYRQLRLTAAVYLPRVTDDSAHSAVSQYLSSLEHSGVRSTDGMPVAQEQVNREVKAADEALVAYLSRASRR